MGEPGGGHGESGTRPPGLRATSACLGASAMRGKRILYVDDDKPKLALAILDFQMPNGDVGHLVDRARCSP